MPPVSRVAAEHYAWGQGRDGWHLLEDASLCVVEERMPPEQAHRMRNCGDVESRFLVISSPRAHGNLESVPLAGPEGEA